MNKTAWIATAVLGLVVTASSEAHAHPPYLQGVSDFVTAEIAAPACSLPGMTCGLCHHPSAGDPLADIVVDIMGIETTLRDRSFYEGLTGEGGWMHSMHMPGDMTHINMNRMALTDEALPAILRGAAAGELPTVRAHGERHGARQLLLARVGRGRVDGGPWCLARDGRGVRQDRRARHGEQGGQGETRGARGRGEEAG